jgi:hypothetical protein
MEATSILLALFCTGLGFSLGRWRLGAEENYGEAAVRRVIASSFRSSDYHLLNNVTLPTADGTTQVDHILVSRFGIFVIESKHYSGEIFGDEREAQWTKAFLGVSYRFQNPIRQNYKHLVAVRDILDFVPTEHIRSVVVFTGDATFGTLRPSGVFFLAEMNDYIASITTEVLSENRLQFCVGRLECRRKAITGQTDIEHAEHLRRKFGDLN